MTQNELTEWYDLIVNACENKDLEAMGKLIFKLNC